MNPLQFIQPGDCVCTFDGELFSPEDLYKKSEAPFATKDIMLVIPEKNKALDHAMLKENIAWAKQYTVPALERQMEQDLQNEFVRKIPHRPYATKHCNELYQLLSANYQSTGEQGKQARAELVQAEVEKWLAGLSLPAIVSQLDSIEIESLGKRVEGTSSVTDLQRFVTLDNRQSDTIVQTKNRKTITDTFGKIPEWLQVLTHAHGTYVLTGASFNNRTQAAGMSLSQQTKTIHPPTIYMNCDHDFDQARLIRVLTEELGHSWHQQMFERIATGNQEASDLYMKWLTASVGLINAIDQSVKTATSVEHPALKLIKKTEPTGGSLMNERFKVQGPSKVRQMELLIDVFDAEVYLRQTRHQNKNQAEQELRRAFGDRVYDVSRQYLNIWLDEASRILEKEIGAGKAAQYKQKWMDDPLNHRITLKQLPEYRAAFSVLPVH